MNLTSNDNLAAIVEEDECFEGNSERSFGICREKSRSNQIIDGYISNRVKNEKVYTNGIWSKSHSLAKSSSFSTPDDISASNHNSTGNIFIAKIQNQIEKLVQSYLDDYLDLLCSDNIKMYILS